MIEATLLYGSKARGDHDRFSDTDLLGISSNGKISKPFDRFGVSFHIYPRGWLVEQARMGALFLFHLVQEAKIIYDPLNIFDEIKSEFRLRESYADQILTGSQVVLSIMSINEIKFNNDIRRRYFWGIRTALMAKGAQLGIPSFSASALERVSKIDGLALHIQTRETASFAECKRLGRMVIECVQSDVGRIESDGHLHENLKSGGGLGWVVAREIEYL